MKHIDKLIETVYEETGIQGIALRVSRNDDGWTALIEEADEILLCPAGERFLVSNGHDSAESAIAAIDFKVQQGFELYKKFAETS